MADNPLANLTAEQLTELLDTLRKQTSTIPKVVAPVALVDDRVYYKVIDGYFETIVDSRDLIQPHNADAAWMYARVQTLQPWYFTGTAQALDSHDNGFVEKLNHKQYVDWLRR
jgi:hypothetical protein